MRFNVKLLVLSGIFLFNTLEYGRKGAEPDDNNDVADGFQYFNIYIILTRNSGKN
jgi:hypothetical protein